MQNRRELIESINSRKEVVRARVREVATGMVPSLFIYGPGGHGKSDAVFHHLDETVENWHLHNSHMTGTALFHALEDHPDRIHVLDDMESSYKDAKFAGILRSACGSVRGRQRKVTYRTAQLNRQVIFEGGIVIISNQDLREHGVLGAVASRMRPLEWRLSEGEIMAIISDAAENQPLHVKGERVSMVEAMEVAEFVASIRQDGKYAIDLRAFFEHGLPTFVAWKKTKDGPHWHEILKSKLNGKVEAESRRAMVHREQEIAVACYLAGTNTQERLTLWADRTGKGRQAFYDRLKEARNRGLLD